MRDRICLFGEVVNLKIIYAIVCAIFMTMLSYLPDFQAESSENIVFAASTEQENEYVEVRLKGRALKPGDTIGILAPGSPLDKKYLDKALSNLKKSGYKFKLAPSCTSEYGYFAGTDVQRASDINHFFLDDEVDGILCMRGGYGSVRVLDKLDYEAIKKHPKQFIGYSDVTAIHVALGEKANLSTIHGPMLSSFRNSKVSTRFTGVNFFKGISGNLYPGEIPMPAGAKLKAITPGEAEGIIVGGNLCLLASLVGTPYELKGDGAILLIEDVDEPTYKVDRILQQLWQDGLFSRVKGVLVGDFVGADEDYDGHDFLLDEVLDYYARLTGKPWVKGVPVGHDDDNLYLPLGVRAKVKADKDGKASLAIVENPLEAAGR